MAAGHSAKEQGTKGGGAAHNSPLMTNHGGAIMKNVQPVQAIFWGTGWHSADFAGDKIMGMDTFYSGVGTTPYARTCSEYSDPSGDILSDSISYNGHIVDGTIPASGGQRAGSILAEVCRVV